MDRLGYPNDVVMDLFIMHGECNRITARTCRMFNERYPELPVSTAKRFSKLQLLFRGAGQINRNKPVTENEDNEVNVLAYFYAHRHTSIRSAASDLGLTYWAVRSLLKKHKMHAFSLKPVQHLLPEDFLRRTVFCEEMLTKYQDDDRFLRKIIWSDESRFDQEGIFNRHNLHYWATENPHFTRPRNFQQRFSVNVFCMLKDNRLSYVLYDGNLNSERYLHILRTTVQEFIDDLPLNDLRDCWYQLDGAPAHCGAEIENFLNNAFEDRWIGRFGPWRWPPRSPDLTPLDFFLWGYIKGLVYSTPVLTREELIDRIRTAFASLDDGVLVRQATSAGVNNRILDCLNRNGHHFENYR